MYHCIKDILVEEHICTTSQMQCSCCVLGVGHPALFFVVFPNAQFFCCKLLSQY